MVFARCLATFLSHRGWIPLYSARMKNWHKHLAVGLAALPLSVPAAFAADLLRWDAARDRVEARVETWTVPELLQRVATRTGWDIYLDPAITNRVSAKFSDQTPGNALRRLLGDYNYALVPETNGASKLFVFRNSRNQATRAVQPVAESGGTNAPSRIGNELIVTLKPGESIDALAKKLGAKVVGRADGQNTYRLRFDDDKSADAARAALKTDSSVESVDSNYVVSRPEVSQATGQPGGPLGLFPKVSADGKYTVVGLIDSAVQGKAGGIADFLLPALSVNGESKTSDTEPTHGTSMAETILRGLSKANGGDTESTVRILPVKIFGENDVATTYDIAVGIYQAVNRGATIINLSLGGDGNSSFLQNTIISAHDQGVVFIAAAGNTPVTSPTYPAAYSQVVAVTASDRQGNLAAYANRGDFVDGIAPGGNLITFNGLQYYVVGTSTSTAFASGVAAALAEANKQGGTSLEAALRKALAPKTQP